MQLNGPTIADLLIGAGAPFVVYAGGYAAMSTAVAAGTCPDAPPDCAADVRFDPCCIDPSDIPFEYFASTRDNPKTMKDIGALATDLAGSAFPAVAYVKPIEYKSEHPGFRDTISAGITFATGVINSVLASRYRDDTLILFTYDEGGGYFDHVTPPPASAVDGKSYGTRVPFVAIGPFAKKNFVSHVVMEHSSVVKFLEWNWLRATGQLGKRDAAVNNIGSVIDATAAGAAVPEGM